MKLAIIGGGTMAFNFANNAKEMNVETYCFSPSKGVYDSSVFDHLFDIDIFDTKQIIDICKENNINGVVATTELTVYIAAYVADALGLICNNPEICKVITDKERNRNSIEGIKEFTHINHFIVSSIEQLNCCNFEYPVILKPTNKGGKRGISIAYSKEDLLPAFEYTKGESGNAEEILVEEFIDGGQEYSVESLSYKGKHSIIQITEKKTSGAPHCVELAHRQPAPLNDEMWKRAVVAVSEGLDAIGIDNGPCHTEIKIKDGKIYLIEFNARPGGDHIAHPLTFLSTGFNYLKGAINIALGVDPQIDTTRFCHYHSAVYFVTEQTKELKPIFDICQSKPWCYKKNEVSEDLKTLIHNNGFNTNYFIYFDKEIAPEF